MYVCEINKPILEFPAEHPARRFLEVFVECRNSCIGQELPFPIGRGIDQEWWSAVENRMLKYSSFAYEQLAFDVELDGWLSNAPNITKSEETMIQCLPKMQSLIHECRDAAIADHNVEMIEISDRVIHMFLLWGECIFARKASLEGCLSQKSNSNQSKTKNE